MSPGKALGVVAGGASACAVLGGLIGWAIGAFAPSAYTSMFDGGNDPGFNPVAVGVCLGVPQGFLVGLAASFLFLFWLKWKSPVVSPDVSAPVVTGGEDLRRLRRSVSFLWVLVVAVLVVAAVVQALRLVERGRGWYEVSCTRRGDMLSFGHLGCSPPVIVTHVNAMQEDKVGVLPRLTFVGPKCGAEVPVASVEWIDWTHGTKTDPPRPDTKLIPAYVFADD